MAERKVFNKYIPPDFDPRLLAKYERPKNGQMKLRSMLPMTLCCGQCGSYMGRGTKFNSRQEIAKEREWKGISVWRFYVKCSHCSCEMTFVTDPENDHYLPEMNCSSVTEPWKARQDLQSQIKAEEKRILEETDSLTALEYRSKLQREQLALLDSISDLQTLNANNNAVDTLDLIDQIHQQNTSNDDTSHNNDDHNEDDTSSELNHYRELRAKSRLKKSEESCSSSLLSLGSSFGFAKKRSVSEMNESSMPQDNTIIDQQTCEDKSDNHDLNESEPVKKKRKKGAKKKKRKVMVSVDL